MPVAQDKKQNLIETQPQIVINNHMHHPVEAASQQPSSVEIEKWGKRLRISAWILVVVGVAITLQCVYAGFNARKITQKILSGEFHGHHNWAPIIMPASIDRNEFELYDSIRVMAAAGFFLGVLITHSGAKAIRSTYMQSSKFAEKTFKRSLIRVAIIFMITIFLGHQARDAKHAFIAFQKEHGHKMAASHGEEEHHHSRKHWGRKLIADNAEEFRQMITPVKDSACDSIKTDKACHANTACSWCTSFAVPSSCNSVEDAKKLPAGVFMCDNIPTPSEKTQEEIDANAEEFRQMIAPVKDSACDSIKTDKACHANTACSWCTSFAVPSSCNSVEDA